MRADAGRGGQDTDDREPEEAHARPRASRSGAIICRNGCVVKSPRAAGIHRIPSQRSALAQVPWQDALAKAQRGGRHLEELVLLEPLEGPLDLDLARR